jgi:hypothetical protein
MRPNDTTMTRELLRVALINEGMDPGAAAETAATNAAAAKAAAVNGRNGKLGAAAIRDLAGSLS